MKNIERSKGRKFDLGMDEKKLAVDSWRYDQVDEKTFLKICDIGDILLFRGKHFGAKITRGVTNSTFDHVAMILRFDSESDEIFFFDATGQGV